MVKRGREGGDEKSAATACRGPRRRGQVVNLIKSARACLGVVYVDGERCENPLLLLFFFPFFLLPYDIKNGSNCIIIHIQVILPKKR